MALQHLAAYLSAEISISRCDLGEIAARFWPPRFPASRQESWRDHGEFLAAEISRISPRSRCERASISRRAISARCRDRGEMGKSRQPKMRHDLAAILAEIATRSRDLVKIFTRVGLLAPFAFPECASKNYTGYAVLKTTFCDTGHLNNLYYLCTYLFITGGRNQACNLFF